MIEPLRYHIERYPPQSIPHPIFCQRCLSNKKTKDNPSLVIKYCEECPRCHYLCNECDIHAHSFVKTKDHKRRIVVIGPAVRKKIHIRGDSRSFPQLFDRVEIRLKAKVIHNGKIIYRSNPSILSYAAGISGQCVHVQILGAKKLPIADAHGSSDPFVCVSSGGKRIGTTRTRPRTINPRWSNETFVIPIDINEEHHELHRKKKSADLIKLEVFDRDYFNFNDFLGHVELTKSQLLKLSYLSNQKPIRLSLGVREYHGRIGLQFGMNSNLCYLKIVKAESLDKMDAFGLSDPFCEVYFKHKLLGKTNVCQNTLDPEWTSGNLYTFEVEEVLKEEIRLRALARLGQAHRPTMRSNEVLDNAALFRIEIFDYNSFRDDSPLGTLKITCDSFRRLAPSFPRSLQEIEQGKSLNHLLHTVRKARNSIISLPKSIISRESKSESVSEESIENDPQLQQAILADHIEDEEESNVDPSMADEDEEPRYNEPKEPSLEFESNHQLYDAPPPGDDDFDQENEPDLGQVENFVPEWRRFEGSLSSSETSGSQQTKRSQIPALNLERKRSRILSEHEGSLGTSRSSSKLLDDGENIQDDESLGDIENQATTRSSMYGRTGRGVTPRVNHNLPSYDDEENQGQEDESQDYSTNQEDDQLPGDDAIETTPLFKPDAKPGVFFVEEEADAEKPSITQRLQVFYGSLRENIQAKYKEFFPEQPANQPTSRRNSLIEVLSKQRKSIVGVTVGLTQWFPMKWFDIQKKVSMEVADEENGNRGQLIVRLIPSMRGHVIRGLDVGVKHMTLGETSTIKVRYDYAYGNFWMGPEIPPRSNINFTVQLLSINGNGHYLQIPWRSFLRFYRMMRRNSRRIKNGCFESSEAALNCWRAMQLAYQKYRHKEKVEEQDSFIEEIEEEEEEEIEEEESEESEDDEFNINDNNRGILVGAHAMWGYDPRKRPKKKKKTKAQKQLEREQRNQERSEQSSHASASASGQMSSRSSVSQQSKASHRSRVSIASRSSKQQQQIQSARRPSKRDVVQSTNSDILAIEYENDSASESSSRPSTVSTNTRQKKGPIDETGHRASTIQGKKRKTEIQKRR